MGSMQLVRALNPADGEEQVTMVKALPGSTRREVKLAACEKLAQDLFAALRADPTVDRIIVSPQILRQRDRDFDGLIITAIALVTRIRRDDRHPTAVLEEFLGEVVVGESGPERVAPLSDVAPSNLLAQLGYAPVGEVSKLFGDYLFRAAEQRNALLEEWAERMLADGEQGIAMIQHESQTMISLHPRVPFGHVFEFPSKDSFMRWADRGYPTE